MVFVKGASSAKRRRRQGRQEGPDEVLGIPGVGDLQKGPPAITTVVIDAGDPEVPGEALFDIVDLLLIQFFWSLRVAALGDQFFSGQYNYPLFAPGLGNFESVLPGIPVLADNEMRFVADLKPPTPKSSGLPTVAGLK
jgi:hypothetical protein